MVSGLCNLYFSSCTLLYVHSSIAIILMGKRELIALLNLSSWCLVMVERLFLAVPRYCLQFVIVVFPDHTHLLFFIPYICSHSIIYFGVFNFEIVISPTVNYIAKFGCNLISFLFIWTLHINCTHIDDLHSRRKSWAEFGLVNFITGFKTFRGLLIWPYCLSRIYLQIKVPTKYDCFTDHTHLSVYIYVKLMQ